MPSLNHLGQALVERASCHHGDERRVGGARLAGGAHHLFLINKGGFDIFWGAVTIE